MTTTGFFRRHARLQVRVLLAVSLTIAGCAVFEPEPVGFADLTADVQVTPSVLALDDTAQVHITVSNPTSRRAMLDVSCGPGYQVFSDGEAITGLGLSGTVGPGWSSHCPARIAGHGRCSGTAQAAPAVAAFPVTWRGPGTHVEPTTATRSRMVSHPDRESTVPPPARQLDAFLGMWIVTGSMTMGATLRGLPAAGASAE